MLLQLTSTTATAFIHGGKKISFIFASINLFLKKLLTSALAADSGPLPYYDEPDLLHY